MVEHPQVRLARLRLNELKGQWHLVERASGLSHSWLSQFARGKITNPTINSLHSVSTAIDVVAQEKT